MKRLMTLLQGAAARLLLALGLVVFFGAIDYVTGYEIGFFAFYYIPIIIAAWTGRPWSTAGITVLCGLVWAGVDIATGHPYSSQWVFLWNSAMRFASFAMLAALVLRLRANVDQKQAMLNEINRLLTAEVEALQGLLPICAACKKIRDDTGYWHEVEVYVRDHSKADFSHGMCPECARAYYPELEVRGKRSA